VHSNKGRVHGLTDRAAKRHGEDRYCAWEGCITRLSVYRRAWTRFCFVHDKVKADMKLAKANIVEFE
jgi:hypothetical protein